MNEEKLWRNQNLKQGLSSNGLSQLFFEEYPCSECTELKCTSSCPYSVVVA